MIKGICITNLDDAKSEIWPDCFVAVPRKGDSVQSKSGRILKVYSVIHCKNETGAKLLVGDICPVDPFIKVELNR